jgi:hypothetical protein
MVNLLALCRHGGRLHVKRVNLVQTVQEKLAGLFHAQANAFLDGISEEVEFGGDWKPDADEILVIDAPQEVSVITDALNGNLVELPSIDAANFIGENIKALFVAVATGAGTRVLLQMFTAQQILARRFSLLLEGNSFKELTAPAFTLDNYLVAIIEDGKLKFKNFHNVKRIFELTQFYEEASDQEIDAFCGHESLVVADITTFKAVADQPIRKMIHAISKTNVLDNYPVDDIAAKAASLGVKIETKDGKIIVPTDRKSMKYMFRFLDDGIYEASLSLNKYITNSKRPFGASG